MRQYVLIIIKFTLMVFFGISLHAQVNLKIEEKVVSLMTENHVPAVGVGIIEEGKIQYLKVLGELKKDVPAPDNTIFNVASITKPFVTMLTLKLVNSGDWDLNEPLYHYWVDPDIADNPWHKQLTTRHVLTHRSGFLNWRRQNPENKLTFEFEPGTKYQYSGEGLMYLQHALENKFNQTMVKLADSILIKPIGMTDTRLYWDENMDESRFAHWHNGNGELHHPSNSRGDEVNSAASLLTTIHDFCLFGIELMNGFGFSQSLYNDMITPHSMKGKHNSFGLGWGVVIDIPDVNYALVHGGGDYGIQTMSVFLPETKQGIVIFTNGDNGMSVYNSIIREYFSHGKVIMNHYYNIEPHEVIILQDDVLIQYTGDYLNNLGQNWRIVREEKALKISGDAIPTLILYPETNHKFYPKELGVEFEFVDKDSLVVRMQNEIGCTARKLK